MTLFALLRVYFGWILVGTYSSGGESRRHSDLERQRPPAFPLSNPEVESGGNWQNSRARECSVPGK